MRGAEFFYHIVTEVVFFGKYLCDEKTHPALKVGPDRDREEVGIILRNPMWQKNKKTLVPLVVQKNLPWCPWWFKKTKTLGALGGSKKNLGALGGSKIPMW